MVLLILLLVAGAYAAPYAAPEGGGARNELVLAAFLLALLALAGFLVRRLGRGLLGPNRATARRVEEARERVGREAEAAVQRELSRLTRSGYHLIFGATSPAFGDVDCLAIGPTGVTIVEVKGHKGTVSRYGPAGPLLRDGHPFEKDFDRQIERQTGHLHAVLGRRLRRQPIRSLICFTRARLDWRHAEPPPGGPYLVGLHTLRQAVASGPAVYSAPQAEGIVKRLLNAYPVSAYLPAAGASQSLRPRHAADRKCSA
jgi:hypothetical protein